MTNQVVTFAAGAGSPSMNGIEASGPTLAGVDGTPGLFNPNTTELNFDALLGGHESMGSFGNVQVLPHLTTAQIEQLPHGLPGGAPEILLELGTQTGDARPVDIYLDTVHGVSLIGVLDVLSPVDNAPTFHLF